MLRRSIVALGAAGALATAAGAGAQIAQPPNGCGAATTAGSSTITLISGGRTRTALVHVPTAAAGRRLPVLFALHGAAQNGTFFEAYTGYSTLADAQHFIAVYPNALPERNFNDRPFWNIDDSDAQAPDDVQFISDVLTRLQDTLCVDGLRVFATGVSNGGGMAARLGCQLSDRIAAIAPVAGGYKALPPCHPDHPVSVFEVHGTSDGIVPYAGVKGTRAGAVMPYVRAWAAADHCKPSPAEATIAPRVVRVAFSGCADGSAVTHLRIVGGGHQLPGALPYDSGQAASIDVPWAIWSFLRTHGRPAVTLPATRG
jgi:polyhydroxybutyrate depolymerase